MAKRQPENLDQPQLPLAAAAVAHEIDPIAALIKTASELTGLSERALSAPGGLEYAEVTLRLGRMGCVNCGATDCPGCGR